MKNEANTIEDLLEILAGFRQSPKIDIESSDVSIMYSIAKQVFKGTALTDRQYTLVTEKLLKYKDQFADYKFDLAVETLRMPLREIDRSKYIKVVSHVEMLGPDKVYESYKEKWRWIKVRFPFSKKLICKIDLLDKTSNNYFHDKGSHEHYFLYTEKNTFDIIEAFKDSSFIIDQELLDVHLLLQEMKDNQYKYIPGVYNLKLKNLSDRAISYILSDIGIPSIDSLALYKDRQHKYGLYYFDENDLDNSINQLTHLSQNIVKRNSRQVLIKKEKYTINNLAESVLELNRFPLLVILPETDPLNDLISVHKSLRGFVDPSECTVMFRLSNSSDSEFNDYIKNNNLNSSLDKNTKVVYINTNKIPKPLIMSDWKCSTALLTQSQRVNTKLAQYIEKFDLVMHYDKDVSQFARFQRDRIQEL
jgi:hypothetical protein